MVRFMSAEKDPTLGVKEHQALEMRESQLWWLAVLVIVLMAAALCVVDAMNTSDTWWVSRQLKLALNTKLVRVSLILAALLICAYFRDSARRLRRENDKLIRNLARYGAQLEKKNREISRLKELSDQLIGLADLQTALDLILGMAVEVIGADTASIMLREKGSDRLRIAASHGLPPGVVDSAEVQIGEAIAGLVAREGKALILNSDELSGEMAKRAFRGDVILSSVIVPIQLDNEIRGVVSIAKRRGSACFTQDDMDALSALANQASLAVQKMELLDDLRSQVDVLGATVQELRQARAELLQSEKLASIGQLAGGVAHEINNPLQVVLGRAEILLADEADEKNGESLKCIIEHTSRIADTVSNLLSFSRQSTDTDFQELDVNGVLSRTLGLLERQMTTNDITIVKDLRDGIAQVFGNAGQLQQVFTNIILNAYQAMKGLGGGTLSISSRSALNTVEIEFADTGPGIPRDHLARIFEPFFTTKAEGEGTGLGLSIAYGIVQSHGGSMQAHSSVGEGACFTVVLPIRQASCEDKAA
ncbi:MAG TPA: ATP-binding protein [Armatimonadota bacterium]|nr:ATP-binding protein [Armatimonadota bacterium]